MTSTRVPSLLAAALVLAPLALGEGPIAPATSSLPAAVPASAPASNPTSTPAPGPRKPAIGSATGLPIDADLLGAWVRGPGPKLPAEALLYQADGTYLRLVSPGRPERGIWTTWLRGALRWLRRCPQAGGGPVRPDDCRYFGRYLPGPDGLIEEEACAEAFSDPAHPDPSFDGLAGKCPLRAKRIRDVATPEALAAALAEVAGAAPDLPSAAAVPAGPVTSPALAVMPAPPAPGHPVEGTWVGAVGTGPEKVELTFVASPGGTFTYTLAAAGQADTASGRWTSDGPILVLEHPDGEIERIPFTLTGTHLLWKDEDLGELKLEKR